MVSKSLPSFDIATYNIHSCIGTDRRFNPPRIVEILNRLDADVLALQEVGWHQRGHPVFDQFDYLRQTTGYAVYSGLTRDHSRAHFGNAILSRLPVRAVRHIDLTVPCRAPRCAVDADIDVTGTLVRVINLHLGLDPWERQVQFKRILRAIEARPTQPLVMLGDFNEWRLDFPPFKDLAPHFPHCLAPRTFHTRRPMFRYDRIYASGDFALTESYVKRTALTRRASDHLPVFGRLALEAATADQVMAA